MSNTEFHFLQNALRKFENKEHLTVYEKSAIGGHFSKDLSKSHHETLKALAAEKFPEEEKRIDSLRRIGLNSFKNDLRMENPIIATEERVFNLLVFDQAELNKSLSK